MSKEVVFFDERNIEFDWYAPVDTEPIVENGVLIIQHNNGHTYRVILADFPHYEWREKKEV